MKTIHLIGISGSLRQGSSNTAVLRSLQEALPPSIEMTLVPLDDVPLYNQDLDTAEPPAGVHAFKQAIAACDGIVICSPEYNFGMPGVLKNALDWASRPAFASPLKGKPVLLMSASPAFTGGVRAQANLREALSGTLARVIARPPVVIGAVHAKIANGRLADAASLDFALAAVQDLAAEVALLRGAAAA